MEKNTHQHTIAISNLYHNTIETYLKHFFKFAGISLLPQLLTSVLGLAMGVTVFSSALHLDTILQLFSLNNRFSLISLLLLILIIIIQIFGIVGLAVMTVHHERLHVTTALKESMLYLFRYIGFGIVITLFSTVGMLLALIPLFLISTAFGAFSQELLNQWYDYLVYLLPLGSAILSTYVIFAGFSIIDKNNTLKKALKHSIFLVRGNFWPIAIRLFLGYAVMLILTYIFKFIPLFSQIIIWVTIPPLTVIYTYVLYNDLNKRKPLP